MKHPEGTRGHPGGTQEARDILEAKGVKTIVFFWSKWCDGPLSREREQRDHHRLSYLCTRSRDGAGVKSRADNT